ncbi:MAG TPA: IscS subfamily cysteine desulfurase [Gemmataceae bacterium]|nr:IscS subfamily cysteine desulfurase [Gemmataceae bacterium]
MQLPIYMDNHATTRTDPRVVEAMLPFFSENYGNAASIHVFGQRALEAVDQARSQIAELIGADYPKEIVFTSGATESNNLALKGAAAMYRRQGDHVITTAIEHRAVLDPCRRLERDGCRVTYLPVDAYGRVSPQQVADAITPKTILVSVMLANNEVGTIQPVAEIGAICRERRVLLHTDATQAVGKIPVDVGQLNADLVSMSAHKMYGPKGIGALYIRRRVRLEPIFDGGGHERGMRSGTLPVSSIVGFGKACELCQELSRSEWDGTGNLRDRLQAGLLVNLDNVTLNGHPRERLAGNLNLSFAGIHGEALLMALKNVAVSSGSACTSASVEPSYVLRAMGVVDELAHASIRFGLGRFNTEEEVDFAIEEVTRAVRRLRAIQPNARMGETIPGERTIQPVT